MYVASLLVGKACQVGTTVITRRVRLLIRTEQKQLLLETLLLEMASILSRNQKRRIDIVTVEERFVARYVKNELLGSMAFAEIHVRGNQAIPIEDRCPFGLIRRRRPVPV